MEKVKSLPPADSQFQFSASTLKAARQPLHVWGKPKYFVRGIEERSQITKIKQTLFLDSP